MVRNIVEETRAGDRSQVTGADDGRQFYQLHPGKRIIVMIAGPLMNLILAVGIFAIVMIGIGVPTAEHHRQHRQRVRDPGRRDRHRRSRPNAPPATTRDPGRASPACCRATPIVAFDGAPVTDWDQLTDLIRASAGHDGAARLRPRRPAGRPRPSPIVRDPATGATTTRASRSASSRPASSASRRPRRTSSSPSARRSASTGDFIGAAAQGGGRPSRRGSRRCGTRSSATRRAT